MPEYFTEEYFNRFDAACITERDFVHKYYSMGYNEEQIFEEFTKFLWSEQRAKVQPWDAFVENAKYTIKILTKKFGEEDAAKNDK